MNPRDQDGRARTVNQPEGSGLLQFFNQHFLPVALDGREGQYASQYRTAIRWLNQALGTEATLADLSVATIEQTQEAARAAGAGQSHQTLIATRLRSLWWFAFRIGAVSHYQRAPRRWRKPNQQRPSGHAEPTAPQEGTIWHFYRTAYAPQRLIGATAQQRGDYERTFRFLRQHFGRDLLLSELADTTTAAFLAALSEAGRTPTTVNGHRARLLAVWRMAFDFGRVPQLPRVKKLKPHWDEPDAWDETEAARIVEATSKLNRLPICGIPAAKWWRAWFLVGYWTGLRRGSLLALRCEDVNLKTGWLHVRPTGIKTRRGKRFRLGPDALAAVREILDPKRELLFPWPADRSGMSDHFAEILDLAGIERSRRRMGQTHKWRRTVATLAASRGGLAAAVALLGHSAPEMTLRYIDPTKLPGNDATELLPALFDGAESPKRSKAS
jgi:integrase